MSHHRPFSASSAALLAAAFLATILWTPHARSQPSSPDLFAKAQALFKPVPTETPALKDNIVTPERTDLGRLLFFDPRLSKSGLISCHTCHNLSTGGDDNLSVSVGHGWQRGPRNSPTVLNAVFNFAQFWDGRAEDLKAQAKGPIQASVEMANEPAVVVTTMKSMPDYVKRFRSAYPEEHDPVNFDNVTKALEAFEATLTTPDSRFDQWLKGDRAVLTPQELRGLELFVSKGCAACHNGVNLGGQAYFPFGLVAAPDRQVRPPGDRGRYQVTRTESDSYVFRAAPLRNVALTAPYFHSGEVWDLREAVAIMGSSQLGIALDTAETEAIAAFLGTLTGRQPTVTLPQLPVETASTPRPAGFGEPSPR
jgi:cytochrome c peroxidase